jgi:hypothetical protein
MYASCGGHVCPPIILSLYVCACGPLSTYKQLQIIFNSMLLTFSATFRDIRYPETLTWKWSIFCSIFLLSINCFLYICNQSCFKFSGSKRTYNFSRLDFSPWAQLQYRYEYNAHELPTTCSGLSVIVSYERSVLAALLISCVFSLYVLAFVLSARYIRVYLCHIRLR